MTRTTPSILSIASIKDLLSNAIKASQELDTSISEDLRVLLKLTAAEAERVWKSTAKAQKTKTFQAEKKEQAKEAQPEAKASGQSVRKAKKATTRNGVVH